MKMNNLNSFVNNLCGHFDNSKQLEELEKKGVHDYPSAKHINHMCNDKIIGIPADVDGKFVLEESYYTIDEQINLLPHLFIFTEEGTSIKLTSYDIPEGYDKESFTYDNLEPIHFNDLKPSEKFNPAIYNKVGNVWEGGSESMFSPVIKFKLHQRFSEEKLVVSEVMEKNGKKFLDLMNQSST